MNKSELIDKISAKTGLNQDASKKALEAMMETVSETLASGDRVQLVGFGTFRVTNRAAREGCNPQTKEKIVIPATKTPSFSAGSELKKFVNR